MIVLCDIDGCIADPCEYVKKYLRGPKKNWTRYYEHTLEFPRIKPIADIVQYYIENQVAVVAFATGRPESNRDPTLQWLNRNLKVTVPRDYTTQLLMRQPKDDRKSYELKLEWCGQYHPDLIIEDEPDTVEALKHFGFKNILQVHGYRISETDAIPGAQGEVLT